MPEITLITIADVQQYRRIDPKFNADRFVTFAMEAQRVNLRDLLGAALYYDFFATGGTIYTDLLNGKTYKSAFGIDAGNDIQYYGLKPALCYWWLAIAAREGDLFLSEHGAISFTDNVQQNFAEAKNKSVVATGYAQTAQSYSNEILRFLNTNSSIYPLWKGNPESSKTEFTTFRV